MATLSMPQTTELSPNFWMAKFELMKRVNAFGVVRRARSEGLLSPNGTVVETTSGSMGLGLAEVCREDGYRCVLVTDTYALDERLGSELRELGAEVIVVSSGPSPTEVQRLRLARLAEVRHAYPHAYWTDQYGNPWNVETYRPVALFILAHTGPVDVLVCTVGSGASSCGIAAGLRAAGCKTELVGVDVRGSVIFGLPSSVRKIRGMGSGIRPANVDHLAYDEVHWLSDAAVISATRRLRSQYGLDVGPTSGAAYLVAEWKHRIAPGKTVCAVFPDTGDRYRATFGNEEWVRLNQLDLAVPPTEPKDKALLPRSTPQDPWCRMRWLRRSLAQVSQIEPLAH